MSVMDSTSTNPSYARNDETCPIPTKVHRSNGRVKSVISRSNKLPGDVAAHQLLFVGE